MGSATDLAQREVAAQRARTSALIEAFDQRVLDDVDQVRAGTADRLSTLQQRVTDSLDLPGPLSDQLASHPLTTLFAGFSAGVGLGFASAASAGDRDDDDDAGGDVRGRRNQNRSARRDAQGRHSRGDHDGGLLGSLASLAAGSLATPLKSELQTMALDMLSGFLRRPPEPAAGRKRTRPAPQSRADTAAEAAAG